jgi:hypothetical protein
MYESDLDFWSYDGLLMFWWKHDDIMLRKWVG